MKKLKFIGMPLLACALLAGCQKPVETVTEPTTSKKPVEPTKESESNQDVKTLTIRNNAAKANTDTVVNALHVYTDGYNDNDDYMYVHYRLNQ